MIDHLYDPGEKQLHYVPVDIDKQSLKRYVQAGKAAKMALVQQQREAEQRERAETERKKEVLDEETRELRRQQSEAQEKRDAIRQKLEQHAEPKGAGHQLKAKEKEV